MIVVSIQTLKRNNKKCGKEESFGLIQKSVESEVTKENLEERLDALEESHSENIKLLETCTCPYFPNLNEDSNNSKERSDETLASNDSLAISEKKELIKFKKSIIEEFDALKSSFFAEVNSFKNKHLNSYPNNISINNSERLIKQFFFFYVKHLHSNIKPTVSRHTYIYIHISGKKKLYTKGKKKKKKQQHTCSKK